MYTVTICEKYDFVDWIWDVCLVDSKLAIGTAHNTVVIWDIIDNKPVTCYYGKERCILYSLAFLNLNGELMVASGTVFTEVHIWSLAHPERTIICKAHEGVIFKLRWNEDGRFLLSVSDDRKLIVWKNSCSLAPWAERQATSVNMLFEGTYTSLFQAYGHKARVWDCLFLPQHLVTTSEDCTVRFWDEGGKCIASMGGHKGKHVWCGAYDPTSNILVTGGNDGSVKLWDVESILQTYEASSTYSVTIPSLCFESPKQPRTSKSECIRDISVTEDGKAVIVASNWGYVWSLDLETREWQDLRIPATHESVSTIALSPDNSVVVQGDCHGLVRIISVAGLFPPLTLQAHDKRIARIAFGGKGDSPLLFVISADNTIAMYSLAIKTGKMKHMMDVKPETKGTITSLLYIPEVAALCIGDSIGTVHLLRLSLGTEIGTISVSVTKQLKKTHGYQPVGYITYHDNLLYTAGHDGKIMPYFVNWCDLSVTAEVVLPVPEIKQIMSVWWTDQSVCCVSGYHESTFLVMDLTNNTQILSIPAGGWKRPFSSYHHPWHPNSGFVFAFAAPSGHSEISIFRRVQKSSRQIPPALLPPSHGRELNTIQWIHMTDTEGILATGGEDRQVQLVQIHCADRSFAWKILRSLDGHSSCVRAIRSVILPDNRGFLLMSCGGRNEVSAWELSMDCSRCHLVGKYPSRNQNTEGETDQRMMCMDVKLVNETTVLMVVGDSCGVMRVFAIHCDGKGIVPLLTVPCHSTPLLSVAISTQNCVFVGTAAGDLLYIDTPLSVSTDIPCVNRNNVHCESGVHAMGINGLALREKGTEIECLTVGDDQSFRISCYDLENGLEFKTREVYERVSGSSIRSLTMLPNKGVFITGWEQKVQRLVNTDGKYKIMDEVETLVPETTCISITESCGRIFGAVCGAMGFEVFELSI